MLWRRIASAVIGIPLLLWLIFFGGWPLFFAVLLLVVLGMKEYFAMTAQGPEVLPRALGYLLAVGLVLGTAGHIPTGPLLFLALAALLAGLAWSYPRWSVGEAGKVFFGPFYIGWLLSHVLLIRNLEPGGCALLLLVFVLTWATDTGAYFVGRSLGKHKLAPKVSPGKTVEGAVGGVLAAIAAGLLWEGYFHLLGQGPVIALSVLLALIGQLGDLGESAIKRLAGVKDSGRVIPGHGGVLDRFDSLFLTAPALYYFVNWTLMKG